MRSKVKYVREIGQIKSMVQYQVSDPCSTRPSCFFQLLMKFKTSQHCEDSTFKLLKKLLTGLINIKANLACEEIKNKIKDW